jgi:hypothetical protein
MGRSCDPVCEHYSGMIDVLERRFPEGFSQPVLPGFCRAVVAVSDAGAVPEEADDIDFAGYVDGGGEPVCLGDKKGGGVSTVARPVHTRFFGIDQSAIDQMIDSGCHAFYPGFARIPDDQVHGRTQPEPALVGDNVHAGVESLVEKSLVYLAHQRVFFARLVIHRVIQDAVEFLAVHVPVFDQLAARQFPLFGPRIEVRKGCVRCEILICHAILIGEVSRGKAVEEFVPILGHPEPPVEVFIFDEIFHLPGFKVITGADRPGNEPAVIGQTLRREGFDFQRVADGERCFLCPTGRSQHGKQDDRAINMPETDFFLINSHEYLLIVFISSRGPGRDHP